MEIINQQTRKTHQRLSKTSARFLEFIQQNPAALKRSNYNDLEDCAVDCPNIQAWPTFINRTVFNRLQQASTGLFHLFREIPGRIFANNPQKISSYFGFPEEYTLLQLESIKDGHLENLVGRGDFIFSAAGPKCIEFNTSAGIGGWQLTLLESTYLNNPIIAKFLNEYQVKTHNKNLVVTLLQHLFTVAKKKFPGPYHREINIAFVTPQNKKIRDIQLIEEHFNRAYQQVLNKQNRHGNGTVIFCDFPGLTVENDCVFHKGKQIHTIVESYHGQVPKEIFYVSLLGNVIVYNGPITSLLSNKLNHVLLSENQDSEVFTPEEREIIKAYTPWTRRIVSGKVTFGRETFQMEDFLRFHRQELIIKPVREMGGQGVYIGNYTPPHQWEKAIERAFQDENRNWIVQEYVETFPYLYQCSDNGYAEHEVVWGLFVFGREYAGGFLRVIPKSKTYNGVINTSRGAQETVIFVVDE
ncbi:MAG: hypothetical protein PVH61_19720 [Candidatus Aminicenantes bacterium]|jgi:hypothetical protein